MPFIVQSKLLSSGTFAIHARSEGAGMQNSTHYKTRAVQHSRHGTCMAGVGLQPALLLNKVVPVLERRSPACCSSCCHDVLVVVDLEGSQPTAAGS